MLESKPSADTGGMTEGQRLFASVLLFEAMVSSCAGLDVQRGVRALIRAASHTGAVVTIHWASVPSL
jgi:hypothetical protein